MTEGCENRVAVPVTFVSIDGLAAFINGISTTIEGILRGHLSSPRFSRVTVNFREDSSDVVSGVSTSACIAILQSKIGRKAEVW